MKDMLSPGVMYVGLTDGWPPFGLIFQYRACLTRPSLPKYALVFLVKVTLYISVLLLQLL